MTKKKADEKVVELIPGVLNELVDKEETVEDVVEQPKEVEVEVTETEIIPEEDEKVEETSKEEEKFLTVEEMEAMSYEELRDYLYKKYDVYTYLANQTGSKKKNSGLAGFLNFKSKQEFAKGVPEWLEPSDMRKIMKFAKVNNIYICEESRFAIVKVGNVFHVLDLAKEEQDEKDNLDDCVTWINERKEELVKEAE